MNKKVCKNCPIKGLCCYHSILVKDIDGKLYNIILKNQPCKYLDTERGDCLIYENRFKINPYCLPIEIAIRQNALPEKCLYVKKVKKYKMKYPKLDYVPANLDPLSIKKILWANNMDPGEFRKSYLPLMS